MLQWTDNAGNESGFRVERKTSSGSYAEVAQVGSNITTYVDTTVIAGTAYCYRVRAYNGAGISAYTNENCATVSAGAPPTYELTVTRAGAGAGTVTGPGISCGTDCSQTVTAGTVVALSAQPAAGSTFTGWSGGGCAGTAGCSVTVAAATTVTAAFALAPATYPLTVARAGTGSGTVTGPGISCGTDCSQTVTAGTVVALSAQPAAGSTFTGWSGGGCAGTAGCSVTVAAATTVTAAFALAPATYPLTVARAGTGSGTVTGPGISCGTDCSQTVTAGTVVALSAQPAAGSTFTGWSGGGCAGTAGCSVTVAAATTVTAAFALAPATYPLTVARAGTGSGTVTGPGISCGTDCSQTVTAGTVVALSAQPAAGSTFTGWSGGGCAGTAGCSVTVAAATTVTAAFALAPATYPLTVARAGTGSGTVTGPGISCGTDCSQTVTAGTVVALSAQPAAGSTFTGWSGGGCAGTAGCSVTVAAATTVTAAFALAPATYPLTVARAGTGSGTVTGPGISCGTDCSQTVTAGTVVALSAQPAAGSTFTGWSGGGCAGTAGCSVTVAAATTVTAAFALAPATYPLTVARAGTGSGTVTGPGISCGTDCSQTVTAGTVVALSAQPAAGSTFTGWSGGGCAGTAGCSVTVAAATTVTASFGGGTSYPLTVTLAGTGQGRVTSSGIDCGQDCATTVAAGTRIELTAVAAPGSVFGGWSGPCAGTQSCVAWVSSTTVVGASFTATGPSSDMGIVAGTWGATTAGVQGFTDDGTEATDFMTWNAPGMEGVFVALGHVDPSGQPVIVAGTGPGVPGTVRILRPDGALFNTPFRPYGRFDDGIRVAACDVDGNGVDEIVTSPGPGKSQPVKVWRVSASGVTLLTSLSYDSTGGRNGKGAFVACADLDGDGRAEIITGLDAGGTPDVSVYRIQGNQASLVIRFQAFTSTFRGGVRVGTADVDGDGLAELLLATGPGAAGGEVKIVKLNGNRPQTLTSFQPEPDSFTGGLFVAGGPRDSVMGGARVVTAPATGAPYVRIFAVSPTAATPLAGFMAGDPAGVDGATVASAP